MPWGRRRFVNRGRWGMFRGPSKTGLMRRVSTMLLESGLGIQLDIWPRALRARRIAGLAVLERAFECLAGFVLAGFGSNTMFLAASR